MSSPHLEHRVSAFVDGELAPAVMESLSEHLMHCETCSAAVAEERHARETVQLSPVPPMPSDLAERLRELTPSRCEAFCSYARRGFFHQVFMDEGVPRPARRRRAVAAVSVTVIVSFLSACFLLGDEDPPSVIPSRIEAAQTQATSSASTKTDSELAAGNRLPGGFVLSSVAHVDQSGTTEVTYGERANAIRAVSKRGILDASVVATHESLTVGEHEVILVETSPWTIAWQTGGDVWTMTAPGPSTAVNEFVAQTDPRPYEDNPFERIARGYQRFIGFVGFG